MIIQTAFERNHRAGALRRRGLAFARNRGFREIAGLKLCPGYSGGTISMQLTRRDEELLTALTWKGRLIDADQIASTWWRAGTAGRSEAKRRAKRLVAFGLLRKLVVLSRPLPSLDRPVVVGTPGSRPALHRAANLFRTRWSKAPRSTTVYLATSKAAALTGGKAPGLKHPLQAGHDRAVMQVYLNAKERQPALAQAWVGEDNVVWPRGLRARRADALVFDASGRVAFAIEIGGSGAAYGKERLEAMHEHFSSQGLSYLLW